MPNQTGQARSCCFPLHPRRPRAAFTLIEVLVVVAIIALLIAILMPSLSQARASARNSLCLGNLHQFSVATQGYASEWRGIIPRGGGPGELHWTELVARMLGDRNRYRNVNQLHVDRMPAFSCPERVRTMDRPFIDYVSNALDPAGPRPTWQEVKFINIGAYRQAADTVLIADAEREDRTTKVYSQTLAEAHANWLKTDWSKPSNWGVVSAIDGMDVWLGEHLPESTVGITDRPGPRRVARRMHLNRFTNACFMDGHAGSLQLSPRTWTAERKYTRWLNLFGVKDAAGAAKRPTAP